MIFTSYTYVAFLTAAFVVHWLLPAKARNLALIVLSYIFYCSWKWQYGFLLLAVSLFTYLFGTLLARRQRDGRLLSVAIAIELVPLVYFKYTGFILSNASAVYNLAGGTWHPRIPDIILPLGISFFTFQGIAYLVDVATGEKPFQKLQDFLLFKAFWPQLIAGPIIRPGEIREQILRERSIDYNDFACGTRRIVRGFFKKVVLADTLAPYVDSVFLLGSQPAAMDSVTGIIGFGLQIYFDFSGYCDIAIGTARLFGFRFPENFDLPYSARSPQEFWNRWHMSLSRWIKDYVFTPLNFSARRWPRLVYLWLLVAMAVCGLWHGARWTFVLWGVWHGLLLVLNQTWLKPLWGDGRKNGWRLFPGWLGGAFTFCLVTAGWLLFRAQTLGQAWEMARAIVTFNGYLRPAILRENGVLIVMTMFAGLLAYQATSSVRARLTRLAQGVDIGPRLARAGYYTLLILAIVIFDKEARAFVYFQF